MPVKTDRKVYRSLAYLTSIDGDGTVKNFSSDSSTVKIDSRTTSAGFIDWRRRISNVESATTTLLGSRTLYRQHLLAYSLTKIKNNGPGWLDVNLRYSGDILPTTSYMPPATYNGTLATEATTKAQIAYSKNVRRNTQTWQSGVFTGELLETARLLASPVKRLRGEVGNLVSDVLRKKAKYKRSTSASRRAAVADTWLTWSFGVKPMISDVNDATLAFRKMASGRCIDSIRCVGVGEAESEGYDIPPMSGIAVQPAGYASYLSGGVRHKDKCVVRYLGAIKNSNPSKEMPLPMMFGLDLSSLLPTAWELIPWSFMVDYFTNVGDAIDAWSMRFIDFGWVNRTVRNSRDSYYESLANRIPSGSASTWVGSFYGKPPSGTYTNVQRMPSTNQFMPSLLLRIPGFPSTKWINIAALVNGIAEVKRR